MLVAGCIYVSILSWSITVSYAASTAKDKTQLLPIIHSAERVTGRNLPLLQALQDSRTLKHVEKIMADSSHPKQKPFEKLLSGKKLHSIRTKTIRQKNNHFPSAFGLINKAQVPPLTDSGPTDCYYWVTLRQVLKCCSFSALQISGHTS